MSLWRHPLRWLKLRRLLAALRSKHAPKRLAAVRGLQRLGDAHAVEPLILKLVGHEAGWDDTNSRLCLIEALLDLGSCRAAVPILRAAIASGLVDELPTIMDRLAELGPGVVAYLVPALEPTASAVHFLNQREPPTAARQGQVRVLIAETLSRMGPPAPEGLIKALHAAMGRESEDAAFLAMAEAIVKLGGPLAAQGIEGLVARLRHRSREVRIRALALLFPTGWRPSNSEEHRWLLCARSDVTELESLGPAAVEPLLVLLGAEDIKNDVAIVTALGRTADARSIAPLRDLIRNRKLAERLRPGECPVPVADEEPALWRAMRTAVTRLGPGAVPSLLAGTDGWEPEQRCLLLELASLAGDARTVETLRPMLRDPDFRVRWAATLAMRRFGWDSAFDLHERVLLALASNDPQAAADLGPAAFDLLISASEHPHRCAECAVKALGALGDRRAVAHLIELGVDGLASFIKAAAVEQILRDWAGASLHMMIGHEHQGSEVDAIANTLQQFAMRIRTSDLFFMARVADHREWQGDHWVVTLSYENVRQLARRELLRRASR